MSSLALLLLSASSAYAHVSLTFPPARSYALDFLDTVRTPKHCGMNAGDVETTLEVNTPINITWHLGYPHGGGFKLELRKRSDDSLVQAIEDTMDEGQSATRTVKETISVILC